MTPFANGGEVHPASILLMTLDSCRYDTFVGSSTPNMSSVGPVHKAMAPGNFTYSSHAAMFMGFTPGVAGVPLPYVNPKYARVFKLVFAGFPGKAAAFVQVEGRNIVDGLKSRGYLAVGTGAVGWFDPAVPSGRALTADFDRFYFPGDTCSLHRQVEFLDEQITSARDNPVFVFLNIGETHVPYYHADAPWARDDNPCVPFGESNDAEECRRRQRACLEFADELVGPLLSRFRKATVLICSDHGDAWGEDGLWEHGIHHEKVFEVPLLLRLGQRPPVIS